MSILGDTWESSLNIYIISNIKIMQEKVENKCIKTLDLKLGSGISILL